MKQAFIAAAVASVIGFVTQSLIIAACSSLAYIALALELQHRQDSKRHDLVKRNWPEVLDSLSSAASAGVPHVEAFADLAEVGPVELRAVFAKTVEQLDSGAALDEVLQSLKKQLADAHCDRTVELIRATNEFGNAGYLESLKTLTKLSRDQAALDGELAAKQGWVMGTAKLAVASPWIIVLLLVARPENAAIYNSPSGLLVLVFGLVICLVAYRLIHAIGKKPTWPRVFA